ncbi:MAG: 5'/3'-nucleotidase SurE [candidate division NC10 bacterium]|nr:5'/3'-nucleotidase SurE [candidate division NC10 bacterium]MBI4390309.1 5'/3'-nucleotidase SurE [candidate division NC10 bacterium]
MTTPAILVTNDDGIHSEGLRALAEALAPLGEVTVVAPDRERSAAGHALTLHRPLRASEMAARWYRVDGTPTDCVTLGIMGMLKTRPRLVAAGINLGNNLGDDVTYSGTVSAAMEGTLLGIPAFAISLAGGERFDFTAAAAFARRLAALLLERGLPSDTLLNVNVPAGPPESIRGVALTRQGRRAYRESIVEKLDPRGKTYYWIGGSEPEWERLGDSDYDAVMEGKISVTPLRLDLTHYEVLQALQAWEDRLSG